MLSVVQNFSLIFNLPNYQITHLPNSSTLLSFAVSTTLWSVSPMKNTTLALVVCVIVCLPGYSQQTNHFDGTTWWNHVKVLAADSMEGRETGSPGLKKAQAYVVDQLKSSGLQPAGVNGFYQPIQFESREIVEKDSSLAL